MAMLRRLHLEALTRETLEADFSAFTKAAWPIIEGNKRLDWNWHLDAMGEYLLALRRREIKRLVINIPFRCMKSTTCTVVFPAWVWTTDPSHQFLTLSHRDDLATRDSVKSRNIIRSEFFQDLWGHLVVPAEDTNRSDRYANKAGGYRLAMGFSAGGTGEGGDTVVIDDAHDAEKAQSDVERLHDLDRYDQRWSTRLNDPATGAILIVMQRLHQKDLSGHVLNDANEHWENLVLPMEYEGPRYVSVVGPRGADPRKKIGELLWPSRFTPDVVKAHKARLGEYGASGQLQQRPAPAGGGVLKKVWWRKWPEGKPLPTCEFVMQSYDTAYEEREMDNLSYSARTTWGIWWDEQTGLHRVLLLEAWRDRIDYVDLRRMAKKDYQEWKPDLVLIEKKASGNSLIQDMRRAGIPVHPYSPDKSKLARAYAAQPMLESGFVYYPDRKWAEALIDDVAMFPKGESSDWTDTMTQALLWYHRRFILRLEDEEGLESDVRGNHSTAKRPPAYG